MKKAKIAELRNGLSRYLEHVRAGGSVLVYDRDTPIAEIVPLTRSKTRSKKDLTRSASRDSSARERLGAAPAIWPHGSRLISPSRFLEALVSCRHC